MASNACKEMLFIRITSQKCALFCFLNNKLYNQKKNDSLKIIFYSRITSMNSLDFLKFTKHLIYVRKQFLPYNLILYMHGVSDKEPK